MGRWFRKRVTSPRLRGDAVDLERRVASLAPAPLLVRVILEDLDAYERDYSGQCVQVFVCGVGAADDGVQLCAQGGDATRSFGFECRHPIGDCLMEGGCASGVAREEFFEGGHQFFAGGHVVSPLLAGCEIPSIGVARGLAVREPDAVRQVYTVCAARSAATAPGGITVAISVEPAPGIDGRAGSACACSRGRSVVRVYLTRPGWRQAVLAMCFAVPASIAAWQCGPTLGGSVVLASVVMLADYLRLAHQARRSLALVVALLGVDPTNVTVLDGEFPPVRYLARAATRWTGPSTGSGRSAT